MIPAEILKKVKQIEIRTRRIVNDMLSGEYHSAFKGRGMEFSEVREYIPGDEIRTIDWNVTARMGRPFVKIFKEERELTVMLVVDASGSGEFGTINRMKGEVGVELAAVLAFSAIKNNDKVGLIIFSSQIEKFIPPKKGRNHVLRVIRDLLYFRPRHTGTDIAGALAYLNRILKKRGVVFLISDFFASSFSQPLRVTGQKHDCIAVTITDPREHAIPPVGLVELTDAETGEEILVDTSFRGFMDEFAARTARRTEERTRLFRQSGVESVALTTGQDYVEPLIRFFKK